MDYLQLKRVYVTVVCAVSKEVFSITVVFSCIALLIILFFWSHSQQPPYPARAAQLPWPGEEDQYPSRDRHTVQDIWHYSTWRWLWNQSW